MCLEKCGKMHAILPEPNKKVRINCTTLWIYLAQSKV